MGKSGQGDNFLIGKIHTKFWVKYLNQSLISIFKFPVQLHMSKTGHASQNLLDQNQHWKHQDNVLNLLLELLELQSYWKYTRTTSKTSFFYLHC